MENGKWKSQSKANRDRQHTGSIGMKARPQDTREKSTLQVIFCHEISKELPVDFCTLWH